MERIRNINGVDEQWKNIPEFPDHEISSFGRLRNKKVDTYLTGSNNYGCVQVCMLHKRKQLHRLVADAFIENPDKHPNVIHLNSDPNDNRVVNLCWTSNSVCRQRQTKCKFDSSQYKGVHPSKNGKKYTASISVEGQRLHLGTFADEKAAARCYDQRAKYVYGELAWLNFPDNKT